MKGLTKSLCVVDRQALRGFEMRDFQCTNNSAVAIDSTDQKRIFDPPVLCLNVVGFAFDLDVGIVTAKHGGFLSSRARRRKTPGLWTGLPEQFPSRPEMKRVRIDQGGA